MVKIIWTEVAIEDLRLIHEYISIDSKAYADRVIDKIINRVEQLQAFSKSGRVVPKFGNDFIRELISAELQNYL